jgi:hypothetical protein
MFGKYSLPGDDIAATYATVVTASAEDPDYLAVNIASGSPSRPAKLTTTSGWFVYDFGVAVNIAAVALIYHNLDAGLAVTIQANVADAWGAPPVSQALTIPAHHEDGWPVSPWALIAGSPSYRWWRLNITGVNSLTIAIGRWVLVGALRQLTEDVLWGEEEREEHTIVEQRTELGIETIYDLGGKRRHFSGEFGILNTSAATLQSLYRSAKGRTLPWLLVPDTAVNDAWFVRFEESQFSRTRETYNHNRIPFRVQELARGLPWP